LAVLLIAAVVKFMLRMVQDAHVREAVLKRKRWKHPLSIFGCFKTKALKTSVFKAFVRIG
jgi:hypothetical protein